VEKVVFSYDREDGLQLHFSFFGNVHYAWTVSRFFIKRNSDEQAICPQKLPPRHLARPHCCSLDNFDEALKLVNFDGVNLVPHSLNDSSKALIYLANKLDNAGTAEINNLCNAAFAVCLIENRSKLVYALSQKLNIRYPGDKLKPQSKSPSSRRIFSRAFSRLPRTFK
jgi:hypothetical protein